VQIASGGLKHTMRVPGSRPDNIKTKQGLVHNNHNFRWQTNWRDTANRIACCCLYDICAGSGAFSLITKNFGKNGKVTLPVTGKQRNYRLVPGRAHKNQRLYDSPDRHTERQSRLTGASGGIGKRNDTVRVFGGI
jgi:hypothetical protein